MKFDARDLPPGWWKPRACPVCGEAIEGSTHDPRECERRAMVEIHEHKEQEGT